MRSRYEDSASQALVLHVNGVEHALRVPPLRRLLDVLRDDLRLCGSKEGCGEGECGACTVLVDGAATLACLVPVCQVDGAHITTIESERLSDVQSAFLDAGGAQCGICTPGMITTTHAHLERCAREHVPVTSANAREAIAGNLCRCTGYEKIIDSILCAARARGLRTEGTP